MRKALEVKLRECEKGRQKLSAKDEQIVFQKERKMRK